MDLKKCLILIGLLFVLSETSGQVDLCSLISEPCMNGGTCINQMGNIACMCPPNFEGIACEIGGTVTSTSSSRTVSSLSETPSRARSTQDVSTTMVRQTSAGPSTQTGSMSLSSIGMRTSTEVRGMSTSSRIGVRSTEGFASGTTMTTEAESPASSSPAASPSSVEASSSIQPSDITAFDITPADVRRTTERGGMSSLSGGGDGSTELVTEIFSTVILEDESTRASSSVAAATGVSADPTSTQSRITTVSTDMRTDMRTEGESVTSPSRSGGDSPTEEFDSGTLVTIIIEGASTSVSSPTSSLQTSIEASSAQPVDATALDTTTVDVRRSTEEESMSSSSRSGVSPTEEFVSSTQIAEDATSNVSTSATTPRSSSEASSMPDDLQCGLCDNITQNGDCASSEGYRTCSPAEVCIFVDAVLISEDLRVYQRSIGCVEENVFEISNGPVNVSDYIVGFDLPFSPEESFGMVRVCDSADFCNQLFLPTTSNPMTSAPTASDELITSMEEGSTQRQAAPMTSAPTASDELITSATEGSTQSTTGGLQCYSCNGERECTDPDIPVITCPLEYNCISLNITVGDDPSTSVSLIRRTCEMALPGGENCLPARDYANDRPSSLPFNLEGVPVSGRACSCNDDLCNANINQEDIESLILVITTQGLSNEVGIEWNILGSGFDFDGFYVQVQFGNSDEWVNVSPLLSTDERNYIITGIVAADVSFVRVIAIDQSKKEISRSLPNSMRQFTSGTRAQEAKTKLSILPVIAISLSIVVLVVLPVAVWFKKTGRILTSRSEPHPLL